MSVPYFPFYPKDWLSDTSHLTFEERGVYFDLICHMWNRNEGCSLPDDDRFVSRLLGVTPARWKRLRAVLIEGVSPVLQVLENRIKNERISKEFDRAVEKSLKAAKSANSRYSGSNGSDHTLRTHGEGSANGRQTLCYAEADLEVQQKQAVHTQTETPKKPPKPSPQPVVSACHARLISELGVTEKDAGRLLTNFDAGVVDRWIDRAVQVQQQKGLHSPCGFIAGCIKSGEDPPAKAPPEDPIARQHRENGTRPVIGPETDPEIVALLARVREEGEASAEYTRRFGRNRIQDAMKGVLRDMSQPEVNQGAVH